MKNKLKVFLFSLFLFLLIPCFAGCGEKQKLEAPKNLEVDYNTLNIMWDKVENADYYVIDINGGQYQAVNNSFAAANIIGESGLYEIKVRAYDFNEKFIPSDYSKILEYASKVKLKAPELKYEGNTLSWEPIQNAQYYTVTVNGVNTVTTKTSFNFSKNNELTNSLLYDDLNTFYVCCSATSNYLKSEKSNIITKYIATILNAPNNVSVNEENDNLFIQFDLVPNAETYLIVVDNNEYQLDLISDSNNIGVAEITSHIKKIGIQEIFICANEIKNQNNVTIFMKSDLTSVEFENLPYFVGKQVQNAYIEEGVLSFDEIKDAESYKIKIGSQTLTIQTNLFDLNSLNLSTGYYDIQVSAINGIYESLASQICNFCVSTILNAPSFDIVSLGSSVILKINEVTNAVGYGVTVNSNYTVYDAKDNVLDIADLLKDGNNEVSVIAIGDGNIYLDSEPTETIYLILKAPTNLKVEDGILSYNAVVDAEIYLIYIDNRKFAETIENSVDISSMFAEAGTYEIYVVAKSGNVTNRSQTITVTIE